MKNIVTKKIKGLIVILYSTHLSLFAQLDTLDKVESLLQEGSTTESRTDKIKELVRLGVYLNAQDENGHTALMLTIRSAHFELTQILIDAGADLNTQNKDGNTALHFAVWNLETTQALVEAGADLDIQNNDGYTALHWATMIGGLKIVQALIEAGADRNIQNSYERTALSLAKTLWKYDSEIEEALVQDRTNISFLGKLKRLFFGH